MVEQNQKKATLDGFVAGLTGQEREIARSWVYIPNTPDCQPEVMGLQLRYGKMLTAVSDRIEHLRKELGCTYDYLQQQLQERLPKPD